ncbi:hypothetical protein [Amycolatopsis panacis]|nr:hypothetical protein [Amycolatopsis panacis]
MTGTTKPRDEEPVGSGPVAAAKQESASHGHTITMSRADWEAGGAIEL